MNRNGKLNILFISSDFSIPPFGGISSFLLGIGPELAQHGHTVHIAVPRYGTGPKHKEYNGVNIHYLYHNGNTRFLRYFQLISSARKELSSFVEDHGIDLVNVHDLLVGPPVAKSLKGKVPFIFTNHTSVFAQWSEKFLRRIVLRQLIGQPDGIIAVSPPLEEKSIIIPTENLIYIPCGVDVEQFGADAKDNAFMHEIGLSPDDQVILYVGRFHPVKGVNYLLDAMPQILSDSPGARLVIAGGGTPEEEKSIGERIDNLGIGDHVLMLGKVDHARLPALYRAAKCLALPSLMETFGITSLEAMASKIPVVATAVGGTPSVVLDGKTGLLVPPADATALAQTLLQVISDTTLQQTLGQAGHDRVRNHFSWNVVVEKTEKFFASVIKSFRESHR